MRKIKQRDILRENLQQWIEKMGLDNGQQYKSVVNGKRNKDTDNRNDCLKFASS